MINYGSFKKLLGETSLERKCRFLFGAALLLLITGSFWLYAAMTRQEVFAQRIEAARLLVPRILTIRHYQRFAEDASKSKTDDASGDPAANERVSLLIRDFEASIVNLGSNGEEVEWSLLNLSVERPEDEDGFRAIERLENGESDIHDYRPGDDGSEQLRFFGGIFARESCLKCHPTWGDQQLAEGDLMAAAQITLPLDHLHQSLDRNRAILVAMAILTVFLAMLTAYAIVRYVIVKPVLHLTEVSDEIARGNLNHRATISTGDEFEKLSQAFNRMLRHMTTVNDELRTLNTDLDRRLDQLASLNLHLHENNRLKDEFLAKMSHEFRTPLNSILGFGDLLGSAANLDDKQKRYLKNIRVSGHNLMALVNDLLELAKIESGRMEIQTTEFRLQDVIEQQIQQIQPLSDQKNIRLSSEIADDIPPLLHDSGKLQQILTNLLSNAIKFTPEGGRVQVSAYCPEPEMFEVCVEDTGIGIPLHEQEHIFEKFRQGRSDAVAQNGDAMTRDFEGTGLGLSIVRELARLLGGDVYLESEFGKGSTFRVRLPVQVLSSVEETIDESIESSTNSGIERITSTDLRSSSKSIRVFDPDERTESTTVSSGDARAEQNSASIPPADDTPVSRGSAIDDESSPPGRHR